MPGVWEHEAVARRSRQWPALERLRAHVEVSPALAGMILVGSFARGEVDPLSDLDVVLVVPEGGFDAAWAAREELHADAALICWDQVDPGFEQAGAHKWITRDLVLVECLLATATSGVRLARPAAVVAGDAGLAERFPGRPPISADELAGEQGRLHAVERAYDELKAAARAALGSAAAGQARPDHARPDEARPAEAPEKTETAAMIEDESAPGA